MVLKLKEEYSGKLNIYVLNANKYQDIATEYNINGVPNYLFLDKNKNVISVSNPKNGNKKTSLLGVFSEDDFKKVFESIGIK